MTVEDKEKLLDVINRILPINDNDSAKDKELKDNFCRELETYVQVLRKIAHAKKYRGYLDEIGCNEYNTVSISFKKDVPYDEKAQEVGYVELEYLDTARDVLDNIIQERGRRAQRWLDRLHKILAENEKEERTF